MGRGGGKGGGGRPGGRGGGGRPGDSNRPSPDAITNISPGRRNAAQAELIARVESYLNAQTATAKRTSKTLRDLQQKVSAARAVTGEFSQWASETERTLATIFFKEGF